MMEKEIEKIEEGAKKKEMYIRNRTDKEYASQINEIESKLGPIRNEFNAVEKSLNELHLKIKELKKRRTELTLAAQPLMKDLKSVNKEKTKFLNKELKSIIKEKNIKKKAIEK
jgi:chromosome segregation ATPase